MSLLSFTAHWITESFERKCAVLNVLPLEESHTGEYLASKYTEMLSAWEIPIERVHLVLRDNAASMEKAMRDALLPSFGCFVQLVVEEGVIAQRAVTDILTTCRKAVGHFKHSATAYNHFHEIQKRLGIATHRLQQDIKTRWNSSYYMLQSVLELPTDITELTHLTSLI